MGLSFYGRAYSQDGFRQSEGFTRFNNGEYNEAIPRIEEFIGSSAIDLGLACSYLGECQYNLYIGGGNVQHLNDAFDSFETSEGYPGIASGLSQGDQYRVKNKKGWCKYRLSERNQNIEDLRSAKAFFRETIDDSLEMQLDEDLRKFYVNALTMSTLINIRMAQYIRIEAEEGTYGTQPTQIVKSCYL